jgi:cytochrome c peroxidase
MRILLLLVIFLNCKNNTKDLSKQNTALNVLIFNRLNVSNSSSYNWNLPLGFPTPIVPAENPMSNEKVELGRFLFHDRKLSQNQTQSCSSCHLQSLAFTDGKTVGIGSTGQAHPRNSQNLANVVYASRLTWANNKLLTLEQQARVPMFGDNPIELGLTNNDYINRLSSDSNYRELFSKAFGGGTEMINEQNIRFAISSFQRSLISGRSRVDRYTNYGERNALTASEIRGLEIFNGETAECFHCHGGFNFADSVNHSGLRNETVLYHNNGIKSQAEYAVLNANQRGLYEVTGLQSDEGKFKAPSLRNIALTFPYMHDGSFTCTTASPTNIEACSTEALTKVVEHYMSGGKPHPNKDSSLIRPFSLSAGEKTDLVNFLKALTDTEFITNTKFSNPFR